MEFVQYIIENSSKFISTGGIFVGFFFVFIECFIPILPLSVFVALNVDAFGFFYGCFISWIGTCCGSFICYSIFHYLERKFTNKFLNRKTIQKIRKGIHRFQNITFTELVLLMTLPFTPSFLINILSGLAKISKEKFVGALIIGKLFSIVFWGYIGKSLLDSLTDLRSIIYIVITLIIAYIISKFVSVKMNIS